MTHPEIGRGPFWTAEQLREALDHADALDREETEPEQRDEAGEVRIRLDDPGGRLIAEVAVAWPDGEELDTVLERARHALQAAAGARSIQEEH